MGGWTGAERKAGPEQEGGNKPGPGYAQLRDSTLKVSPCPAHPSYVQGDAVTSYLRNLSTSDRGKAKGRSPEGPWPGRK